MKVLIGCEFSGIVREAFKAKGHDAWSCDLLDTEIPGNHIKGDVLEILNDGWDMMVAHPPCTYLTSANTYINRGCSKYTAEEAEELRHEAVLFFFALADAPIPKICIENPIGIMSRIYRKPNQIIQPWEFGHAESKATCFWLKGLPILKPTKYADWKRYRCRCGGVFEAELGKYGCPNCAGEMGAARPLWDNQTKSGQNKLSPGPERAKLRSKTYQGIAKAMAEQWNFKTK